MAPQASFSIAPGASAPRRIEAADARADGRRRIVLLGRERIEIARSVGGVFMHIALAPSAYSGIVLRLSEHSDGGFHYEVRLAHRDPDLAVTLLEADDDCEATAEWRLRARLASDRDRSLEKFPRRAPQAPSGSPDPFCGA